MTYIQDDPSYNIRLTLLTTYINNKQKKQVLTNMAHWTFITVDGVVQRLCVVGFDVTSNYELCHDIKLRTMSLHQTTYIDLHHTKIHIEAQARRALSHCY